MSDDLDAELHVRASVKAHYFDDGGVLLDIDKGVYFKLNAVGALVWKGLSDADTVSDIISKVASTYALSEAQARSDVRKFICELTHNGLLTPKEK